MVYKNEIGKALRIDENQLREDIILLDKKGLTVSTFDTSDIEPEGTSYLMQLSRVDNFEKFLDLFDYLKSDGEGYSNIFNYLQIKFGENYRLYPFFEEKLINSGFVLQGQPHEFLLKESAFNITNTEVREIYFGKQEIKETPQPYITVNTGGGDAIVAGRNISGGKINAANEDKNIQLLGLDISRKTLIWTIAIGLIGIVLGILALVN